MSIQGLYSAHGAAERRTSPAVPARTAGTSFRDQLTRTSSSVTGPAFHLRMPGENTVFSGNRIGRSNTAQEIYAEYTADSTPDDPVVRVTGTSDSGPYSFTCRVNDIDPSNASYAEMAALYGHLVKTGAYQSALGGGVLPTGLETGDVTVKRDYLSAIEGHQYDRRFGGVCRAQAAELLALYQPYASGASARSAASLDRSSLLREDPLDTLNDARLLLLRRTRDGQEWKKEQEEWDRLMKCLDSWIDAQRDAADREREERGVTAAGGEALLSMYRGLIAGAVRQEMADPAQSREDLLSALTEAQGELLERLKEDKAAEEEREAWVDLLKRLDKWIEALRGELPESERVPRTERAAAGERTAEYKT